MPSEPARWRDLLRLQVARHDLPRRELAFLLGLIVAVWLVNVLVLERAYDRDYFRVVAAARTSVRHCRDMIVEPQGRGTYHVRTCGRVHVFQVQGGRVYRRATPPPPRRRGEPEECTDRGGRPCQASAR